MTPLPAQRATGWHTFDEGQRRVRWWPGYDCRVECQHTKKGEHGQHCDEVLLDLRDGDIAVVANLWLMARAGERLVWPHWDHPDIYPTTLVTHVGYPFRVDDVRTDGPSKCDVLKSGACYATDPEGTVLEKLWMRVELGRLPELIADAHIEHHLMECDSIWRALGDYMTAMRVACEASRDTLPVRCPHCDGTGLIARDKETP